MVGARNSRDLFLRLSALGGKEIAPGDTLVFLDEIQECGDVLTWMKFLLGETGCDYYNTAPRGEIDFVLQTDGGDVMLCEVKSGKAYRRHSALNNLLGVENYEYGGAYVFCDGNVSAEGRTTYLPVYMVGCLRP